MITIEKIEKMEEILEKALTHPPSRDYTGTQINILREGRGAGKEFDVRSSMDSLKTKKSLPRREIGTITHRDANPSIERREVENRKFPGRKKASRRYSERNIPIF